MKARKEKRRTADTLVRSIRLPRDVHDFIQKEAQESCRTFRQQVEFFVKLGAKAAKVRA